MTKENQLLQTNGETIFITKGRSNRKLSQSTLTKFDDLSKRTLKRNMNMINNSNNRRLDRNDHLRVWALEYDYSDDDRDIIEMINR